LGPRHAATLDSEGLLGACLEDAGDPVAALELWERHYLSRRDVAGAGHPDTLEAQATLVAARLDTGREKEGLEAAKELADLSAERYGPDHPAAWRPAVYWPGLDRGGRPEQGLPPLEDAARKLADKLGPDHPLTSRPAPGSRRVWWRCAAAPTPSRSPRTPSSARRKTLGEGHRDSLSSMTRLADVHAGLGDREAGLKLLDDQLAAWPPRACPTLGALRRPGAARQLARQGRQLRLGSAGVARSERPGQEPVRGQGESGAPWRRPTSA
jgi:hypothetical protein